VPLRSLITMLILGALAFAIVTKLERLERESQRQRDVVMPDVDYALQRVQLSLNNAKAKSQLRLEADRIEHLRKTDELLLSNPVVQRFGKLGERPSAPQEMRAQSARVYQKGSVVLLYGGVVISTTNIDQPNVPIRVQTESIWLRPAEKQAETSQSVQIQHGGTTLSGRGLTADFASQTLELKQDAHARIEPQRRTPAR
jgi:LPS export ABC transporter protein LptC